MCIVARAAPRYPSAVSRQRFLGEIAMKIIVAHRWRVLAFRCPRARILSPQTTHMAGTRMPMSKLRIPPAQPAAPIALSCSSITCATQSAASRICNGSCATKQASGQWGDLRPWPSPIRRMPDPRAPAPSRSCRRSSPRARSRENAHASRRSTAVRQPPGRRCARASLRRRAGRCRTQL